MLPDASPWPSRRFYHRLHLRRRAVILGNRRNHGCANSVSSGRDRAPEWNLASHPGDRRRRRASSRKIVVHPSAQNISRSLFIRSTRQSSADTRVSVVTLHSRFEFFVALAVLHCGEHSRCWLEFFMCRSLSSSPPQFFFRAIQSSSNRDRSTIRWKD